MNQILIAVLIIGGMGLLFGTLLGIASRVFAVETDERIPKVTEVLPGANCGGCGFAGCGAYADAIVTKGAPANLCPVGGRTAADKIAEILGIEVGEAEKKIARVLCAGGSGCAAQKYVYDGPMDCHSAARLGGGEKMCPQGCLGLGSCVKVCYFGAISVESGIAVVDESKCGGCGACARECPKNVIKIMPEKTKFAVTCKSTEKGKLTRQVCEVGCIGCGICAKNCPKEAIEIRDNLAFIDEEKCVGCGICASKCPQHSINKF